MGRQSTERQNRRHSRAPAVVRAPRVSLGTRLSRGRGRVRAVFERCKRPLAWIARGLVLIAVTAGAVAGGRLLEQHVRSAEGFATREIDVTGLERLSREEVLSAAGLAVGQNVFEVSPEQARAHLLAHPWIADATVNRRLPGSYRVSVREQQPAALLQLEALYLVGEDGSVFKRAEASDPVDLPIITGVDAQHFRSDLAFRTAVLVNAIALLHDYRDVGLWHREPVAEIHAESDDAFSLYVGKDAMLVRLGERPFRKKLRRLRGILDELRDDSTRPAYVYLDNVRRPDRVAVRLR
jgi:cell division protein FtsQ